MNCNTGRLTQDWGEALKWAEAGLPVLLLGDPRESQSEPPITPEEETGIRQKIDTQLDAARRANRAKLNTLMGRNRAR